MICLKDSKELFLVVILVLSYLFVRLIPYWHTGPWAYLYWGVLLNNPLHVCSSSNFTTFAKCICTACK
jgi:hypothetical protein